MGMDQVHPLREGKATKRANVPQGELSVLLDRVPLDFPCRNGVFHPSRTGRNRDGTEPGRVKAAGQVGKDRLRTPGTRCIDQVQHRPPHVHNTIM